ncbi:hypothetical protein PVAP13_2NG267503 [Panicum virgatum]|uniref:WRKY domain-containing protein n=1 Tax=Panicum virgatum TaxID=38727 RepID=A0A8T0VDZ6_PANVG|nr:hypothetical protein PVAP13_2NG267503 [Panicum virgatum]
MAAGPGGATVERFIVGAQKSTNQLKGCAGRATSGCWTRRSRRSRIPWQRRGGPPVRHHGFAFSSARVSAAQRAGHAAIAMAEFYWCRRRRRPRSAPRRSGQRVRYCSRSSIIFQLFDYNFWTDGACRMIVLQHGVQDSYTWRKYGQKEILGARFPRSYIFRKKNKVPTFCIIQRTRMILVTYTIKRKFRGITAFMDTEELLQMWPQARLPCAEACPAIRRRSIQA